MSKRSKALAQRFEEVMLNGKWIAFTNVKEQLEKTSLKEATTEVGDLNTIAALAFHLNYYIEGMVSVLKGGPLVMSDKDSFNIPELKTESEWNDLKTNLSNNSEVLRDLISGLSEDQLNATFFDEKYGDYHRNMVGMTEHGYYHLGQIVIIRKMMSKSEVPLS